MSHENFDFETSWNLCFSALKPKPSSVFWLILPSMLHQTGQFRNQLINQFIFSEKFSEKVLVFAKHGHLQALKVLDLKVLCLSQLHGLKDRQINVRI